MSKQAQLDEVKKNADSANLPLKEGHNMVFGKGSPEAAIIFIGEAPGEKEDTEGIPFVGSAGKNLDKLLGSIGLSLDDVYIANILKYRPPENRNPSYEEIVAHTPYLISQIKIIRPRVIVTMGNFATKFVLGNFNPDGMKGVKGITMLHGKSRKVALDGDTFLVMPTYHPAAVLYNPKLRGELEADFALLGKIIAMNASVV